MSDGGAGRPIPGIDPVLAHELELLEAALASAPIAQYLRSGLSPEESTRIASRAGIALTSDLVTLYAWHDGTDADVLNDDGSALFLARLFFDENPFLSLEEAVQWLAAEGGNWADGWSPLQGWPRDRMLPFMCDTHDAAVQAWAILGDDHADVRIGIDVDPVYAMFGTLTEFVTAVRRGWEQGLLRPANDGDYIERDRVAFAPIMVDLGVWPAEPPGDFGPLDWPQ